MVQFLWTDFQFHQALKYKAVWKWHVQRCVFISLVFWESVMLFLSWCLWSQILMQHVELSLQINSSPLLVTFHPTAWNSCFLSVTVCQSNIAQCGPQEHHFSGLEEESGWQRSDRWALLNGFIALSCSLLVFLVSTSLDLLVGMGND